MLFTNIFITINSDPSTGKNATECGSHELSQAPSQIPPGGAYGRSVPLLPIVFTIAVLLVAVIATIIAALFVYHYRRHRKGMLSSVSYTNLYTSILPHFSH